MTRASQLSYLKDGVQFARKILPQGYRGAGRVGKSRRDNQASPSRK